VPTLSMTRSSSSSETVPPCRQVRCTSGPASRLHGTGVTVNGVHPGLTATPIVDDIAHPLMKPFLGLVKRSLLTPAQGAAPVLRLATAPELADVTGRYFVRDAGHRSPAISYDRDLQQRIWDASTAYIGAAVPEGNK
jgi:hypothetical protein